MKNALNRTAAAIALALLLLSPEASWTQEKSNAAPKPDPTRVFAGLIRPYRNLNDYTVRISAKIQMPTIRIPDFSATLYYKRPDLFRIETKSFAPIPRNSGVFDPLQFDPEKNRIAHIRRESMDQMQADLYRVEPLDVKSQVRYFLVWVGGAPGQILQVEYVSVQGTRGLVKISPMPVSQRTDTWLLPEKVHIHLIFPEAAKPSGGASSFGSSDNPISGGMRRLDEMSGEGDIDIIYSNWKVNTGLDESLFKKDGNPSLLKSDMDFR